ncbi:hypothetical protein Syun_012094 [Stephania yunnanensis]|uniref:Uncharacterized protein n=1 Tax=Stephania yunnanensis TaxID=152371 RepID=A0AAP0JZK7_9MAGN
MEDRLVGDTPVEASTVGGVVDDDDQWEATTVIGGGGRVKGLLLNPRCASTWDMLASGFAYLLFFLQTTQDRRHVLKDTHLPPCSILPQHPSAGPVGSGHLDVSFGA